MTLYNNTNMLKNKKDDELAILKRDVSPIVAAAENMDITDGKRMEAAAELLSTLNRQLDRIENEKTRITKPLNEALKAERSRWKPFETELEGAISTVRGKMSAYQTEQKRVADEEAARIAARTKEGKGNYSIETAVKKIAEIDTPEKKVVAESGSVSFIEVRKFEVMDVSLLPTSYVLPDLVAIRKAMLNGLELPGCRYYVVQEPRNTR